MSAPNASMQITVHSLKSLFLKRNMLESFLIIVVSLKLNPMTKHEEQETASAKIVFWAGVGFVFFIIGYLLYLTMI